MTNGRPKRSSIFTGLLLILIGVIFLLDRFDPALGLSHLILHFWPVLIILWGVAKLFDHLAARNHGEKNPALLSGAEAVLLVLLVFVLAAFVLRDRIRDHFPDLDIDLEPFHQSYSQTRQLAPQTIPAGARVTVETAKGDIVVHVGEGSDLRVSVNESASAANESDADNRMKNVEVVIEHTGNIYGVHPLHQEDSRPSVTVDLDVQLPKAVSVTLHTAHGDIDASGIAGTIEARSESGDIEIHDVGSDVTATLQKGDARITGVAGNVRLSGRGNDIELGDIAGDATIEGSFFGSTLVRKVGKTTRFASARTDLTIERLTGRLELDSDSLEISDVAGPAKIVTRDKSVQVENVAGQLDIANSHSDVKVAYATPPREALNITNEEGEVEVMLPPKSAFAISAVSRSGEVESDFEDPMLKSSNDHDSSQLTGQFGAPGPKITIKTSYGKIELRKSAGTAAPEARPNHSPTVFQLRANDPES